MTSTNRRRELEAQDASPIIAWLHRFSAFALIFVSAAFTIWFRLDDSFLSRARAVVDDMLRPVSLAVAAPVYGVSQGIDAVGLHFDTVGQLETLSDENEQIAVLQEEIARLSAQLDAANAMANIPQNTGYESLTLRVINGQYGDVSSQLQDVVGISNLIDRRLIKVNAGRAYGVREGMPVINDIGLVGRVIEVSEDTATVMLVFDTATSVPALIEALSARVTIKGTGARDTMEIKRASSQVSGEISVGDRIVTSGQGEVFPPGILIGTVVNVDQGIQVEPAVDWERLVHVRVLPRLGALR